MPRIVMNQAQYQKLNTQQQEVQPKVLKSFDSEVELFDYEPMKKYFVYIPKIKNDNGEEGFGNIITRAYLHSIKTGNTTQMIRCINGLVNEEIGFTGVCPLCEGVTDAWDYYNIKLEAKGKLSGIDINSSSDDAKELRSAVSKDREIKEPNAYVAFPIILIESEFDTNGKLKLVKGEDGKYIFKPQVFVISEYNFKNCFQTQLDNQEINDMCGHFLVLSYVYDTKGKKPEKRDAGRNLNVTVRSNPEVLEKYIASMDKQAEFLTPFRIESAVASFALYPVEELTEKKKRALLAYEQSKALLLDGGNVTTLVKKKTATPEQAVAQFADPDEI